MSDDDPDAIWRSDDVPVPPAPTDELPARRRETSTPITFETIHTEQDRPAERVTPLRVIVGAAIAAIVITTAIIAIVGGGSDDPDEAADAPTTDASAAPTTVDDPVESTQPPRPSTTLPSAAATPVPDAIELPPAVSAIGAPTEVLALAPGGLLHTLSLPSGRVRTVDLNGVSDASFADGFGGLVVSPDAAAITVGGSNLLLVPRVGDATEMEFGGDDVGGMNVEGWMRAEDGSTRFVVAAYSAQRDNVDLLAVSIDGEVDELPDTAVSSSVLSGALQGGLIVNDAGGAYRVSIDGTSQRIEDGVVLAHDDRHRLVRECDDRRQCATVIVTEADGSRREIDPVVLPDGGRDAFFGITLAPDGSAASVVRNDLGRQERVIVDFTVGEVASGASETWQAQSTWAADSSGVFDIAGGELQFLDRATGESSVLAEELEPIITLGVRHPDAELPADVLVVATTLTPQEPIGPTGLVLAAAGRTGGVGLLDVDALEFSSWQAPLLGQGAATLTVSDDSIVALPADGSPAFLTSPNGTTPLGDSVASEAPMLPGPAGDTVWVTDDDAPASDVRYRLLRLDGTVADDLGVAAVDVADATLLGGDGRGALVLERRGGLYVAGVDGTVQLTSGQLLAIGAWTAYVRECTSIDDCVVTRIDRASGARTSVPTSAAFLDALVAVDDDRGAALGTTVSPDGDVLVSRALAVSGGLEPTLQTLLFDVATGEATFVDGHTDDQPIVWNDDSTFAALLVGPDVEVYDRAEGRTVALTGARIRAIGPGPRE